MRRNPSEHHILHEAWAWDAFKAGRTLRNTESLKPNIDRTVHNELHKACPIVPVLGSCALEGTLSRFQPIGNTLVDMDRLCLAMDRASKVPKARALERDLAGLAIEAIELQRPFIIEGMIKL